MHDLLNVMTPVFLTLLDYQILARAAAAISAAAARPPTPTGSQAGKEASGGRKYVGYRLDPAPSWSSDQPEKHYKEYIRNLQLWLVEAEARLPHKLIGKKIIDSTRNWFKAELPLLQGHKTIFCHRGRS